MVVTLRGELLGANQLAHREALIGVERAERLVHQIDGRAAHDRARERHLLLVAAGELLRVERRAGARDPSARRRRRRGRRISARREPGGAQRERDVARARSGADRARRTGTPCRRRAATGAAASRRARRAGSRRRSRSSRPAIMRSVVVLPQPDGPSSTTNSPCSTARSMPSHGARAVGVGLLEPLERRESSRRSPFARRCDV